jgi:hypothetical protein
MKLLLIVRRIVVFKIGVAVVSRGRFFDGHFHIFLVQTKRPFSILIASFLRTADLRRDLRLRHNYRPCTLPLID